MKTLFGAALVVCAALATSLAQAQPPSPKPAATVVTILQPTASSGPSPIAVAASVNSPVHVLQLYVDGAKQGEVAAMNLNWSVNLPTGPHRIVVQALDSTYHVASKAVTSITVTAPPPPAGTTLSNLQESTNWETCGSCGNNGGKGKTAVYSMTRGITSPAINNLSTSSQFDIGGLYAYTNGYWFLRHNAPKTNLKSLVYDFYLYVPSVSAKAPQAIEFECQHTLNHYVHNFAWQVDYARKQWRIFDYSNNQWIATSVPFTGLAPDTWHHLIAEYHEEGSVTVHDALTVDGVRTVVSIKMPGTPTSQSWASFSNAFQLDLNGVPTGYTVYVDKMKVTYQ